MIVVYNIYITIYRSRKTEEISRIKMEMSFIIADKYFSIYPTVKMFGSFILIYLYSVRILIKSELMFKISITNKC